MKKTPANTANPEDLLRRLAFDNSLQPNIISIVSSGQIILANKAACKLLGYSMKGLLATNSSLIFNNNQNSFKQILERDSAGNQMMTVTRKSGSSIPCEISFAVFKGAHGIDKAITAITDKRESISRQKKIDAKKEKIVAEDIVLAQKRSDAKLVENTEWIKYIATASYDVMWDWNIETGQVYVGESIKGTFGYPVKNNMLNIADISHWFLPEDKSPVQQKLLQTLKSSAKTWNDAYILKRYDGTLATTISRASIIRDDDGRATRMIGATQDVSRLQELETSLEDQIGAQQEQRDIFNLAAKLSYDGIWDWNIITDDLFLGEGFDELLGYAYNNTHNTGFAWSSLLHPDDKVEVEKGMRDALESSAANWEHAYRFIRKDRSVATVFARASIARDDTGKATRMIGVIHDLSRQRELEEELVQQIRLKEKQVSDAIADARESTRSDIGKELHDNVNQLLGASKMYLEMAKRGGSSSAMYLSRSSEYTLNAIEEIRKLTKGLSTDIIKNLGLCAAVENIAADTMEVNPLKIACRLDQFDESGLDNKFKLNIFRIIQEQLSNILKHSKATKAGIGLSRDKVSIKLLISDNGIGFDTNEKRDGIGIANIMSRAADHHGKAEFVSQPSGGCVLTVLFSML